MDALHINIRYFKEYRDACILCFTESWLTEESNNDVLQLHGFMGPIRADRDLNSTVKESGGGVCFYINERWCSSVHVKDKICTDELELLSISLRPFYLPREYGQVIVTGVYISPYANANRAAQTVYQCIEKLETASPGAPKIILGDFNSCRLDNVLPTYEQHVTCSTRKERKLDLCYSNVTGAYRSIQKSSIGSSDQLLPTYKHKLKQEKVKQKIVQAWSSEAVQSLQGCFACTDW